MFAKSESVDLKRKYTPDIRRTLAAFANTNGGTVYIGVGSEGAVEGVIRPEAVISAINNIIKEGIKPSIAVFTKCDVLNIDDTKIVAVRVQRGLNKPYFLPEKGMNSEGVYSRTGAMTSPATDADIANLLVESEPRSCELQRSLKQNLTFDMLTKVLKFKGIELNIAKKQELGLIGQDSLYTNLAMLLSDQCSHGFQMTRYAGVEYGEAQEHREVSGSLLTQLKKVCEFAGDGFQRTALQELVINAIIHRDYSRDVPTKLNVFDDRLELISYGGIFADGDIDSVQQGLSICRNPELVKVFGAVGVVKAYGAGLQKVKQCYAGLVPKVEFSSTADVFKVVLPHSNVCRNAEEVASVGVVAPVAVEEQKVDSLAAVPDELEPPNTETVGEKVLAFVERKGMVTRPQVEKLLSVSLSTANRILKALEKEKLLECVGKGRNTKYRINRT